MAISQKMSDMQQYTCPTCHTVGAHGKDSPAPLCHICDYDVTMLKSHNGIIIENPLPQEWSEHVEEIIEQFFEQHPEKRKH